MIAALTLAALVGTWSCTSPEEPRSRFVYVFKRNGTGTLSAFDRAGGLADVNHFTFRITNDGYVMKHSPDSKEVRERISVHGGMLEDQGYRICWTAFGLRLPTSTPIGASALGDGGAFLLAFSRGASRTVVRSSRRLPVEADSASGGLDASLRPLQRLRREAVCPKSSAGYQAIV